MSAAPEDAGGARRSVPAGRRRSCTTTPIPAPATAPTSPSSCRCSSRARLIAFAATTAHHLDIGALSPGSCGIVEAIDAYAEGLQFKAIKVYDRGVKNDMVWQIVRDNIRASDLVVGDMDAQVAAARIGAERMAELVERYGLRDLRPRLRPR